LRDDAVFEALIYMSKSTLFGVGFAAGAVLAVVSTSLLNREPVSSAMTTAKLTMQKATSSLSDTFATVRRTVTFQGKQSDGAVRSPGLVSPAPALAQKLRNNLP